MKNKNLYEVFDCSNKYELIDKLKNNDESVRDLQSFINYSALCSREDRIRFDGVKALSRYVPSLYQKGKDVNVFFLDNLNSLIQTGSYDYSEFKNLYKDSITSGANNYIFCFNEFYKYAEIDAMISNLKTIGLEAVDGFYYYEGENFGGSIRASGMEVDSFVADKVNLSSIGSKISVNAEPYSYYIPIESEDFSKYSEYSDFIKTYTAEEMKGLNVINDLDKIRDLLLSRTKFDDVESMGVISVDYKNNIISNDLVSIGTVNHTFGMPNDILRIMMKNKNVKKGILYHNHPSGGNEPSRDDLGLTDRVENTFNILDLKLIDHFVIGDELTSIFDYKYDLDNSDYRYREAFQNLKNKKNLSLVSELSAYKEKLEKENKKSLKNIKDRTKEQDL